MIAPPKITHPSFSHWSTPKSILADYNYSNKLPQHADVIIIGSGFSGASTAYHLLTKNPNLDIVMLEAREVCSGASGRNGGHLAPNYLSDEYEFEKLNFDAVYKFILDNGIEKECLIHDNVINGHYIYERQDEFNDAKTKLSELSKKGVINTNTVRILDKKLVQQELGIKKDWNIAGAISAPTSPINPYKLTSFILKQCVAKGLKLYTHTPVTSINEEKATVDTNKGSVTARQSLVLCTNAYTSQLAKKSPIVPTRGQVARFEVESAKVNNIKRASIGIYDEYLAIIPNEEDEQKVSIVFGGLRRYETDGQLGITDDNSYSPLISTGLQEKLQQIWDISTPPIEQWTGIMGFCEKPVIGCINSNNKIYACAGFDGHGMPRIFKSGEALANFIINNEWPSWFPDYYRHVV